MSREAFIAPPGALLALMAATLVLGIVWTLVTPAFSAPDEPSHFAYTQYLAETFDLPGEPSKPVYSSEHIRASAAANSDQVAAQLPVKPEWSGRVFDQWKATTGLDPRDDGGGSHSAAFYPPLAYLWQAGGYRVAGGDFFDRLTAARIASVLWLPVTVLATWLLAGEIFGPRRLLQLCAAAVPALLPMVAFISASVSPDGMLYALWSLALWLGVRVLRRGLTVADGAALGAVVGLACIAKTGAYAIVPAFALAVAIGLWRARGSLPGRALAVRAVAAGLPMIVFVGGWFALSHWLDRPAAGHLEAAAARETDLPELLSYVWQYYLPRLPGQDPLSFPLGGHAAFQVWIKQIWAAFGWLEVKFPVNVYRALGLASAAVAAAAAAALWRARRRVDWGVAAFLALAVLALLGGLHWNDYHELKAGRGFIQGRYLFPVVAVGGLALAAAIDLLPARARGPVAGATVAALFAFHVAALGLVLDRFYA